MIISICAVRTLRNIVSGYTVAYATAGASFGETEFANASAGGSVIEPESSPNSV